MSDKIIEKESSRLRGLVEACPVLSPYQKGLLIQIDVEGKTVTQMAEDLGKAKSTVSSQHADAFRKFTDWRVCAKPAIKERSRDFDGVVFKMFLKGHTPVQVIAKYGNAEKVMELAEMWKESEADDFWDAVRLLRDYGVATGSSEITHGTLRDGIVALGDRVFEAERAKEAAKKRLVQYEKKLATVKELETREKNLRCSIESLNSSRIELERENGALTAKNKALNDENETIRRENEELLKQTLEDQIHRDLLKIQLDELKKNLRYYRTKHGKNVKIGDLVSRKDYPLLYLVVGESPDKNSWEIKIFDNEQLAELRKKYELPKKTMKGPVSKKEIIENWEIVDVTEDLAKL